jgi:hypothetical protein
MSDNVQIVLFENMDCKFVLIMSLTCFRTI